jgi:hypothetical protein
MNVDKVEYARAWKKWISHKKVLAKQPSYNTDAKRLEAMSKIWNLFVMVKNDCDGFSLNALFNMVKLNEENLRAILPLHINPSYESSLMKLEELLMIAKTQK